MQKGVLILFLVFLVLGLYVSSPFILADDDDDNSGSHDGSNSNSVSAADSSGSDEDENDVDDGDEDELRIRERMREDNCTIKVERELKIENGKRVESFKRKVECEGGVKTEIKIRIENRTVNGEVRERVRYEIRGNEIEVEAEDGIELEEETNGTEYKLKARLRNGQVTDIKVMPYEAMEIALEELRALNFTIELVEAQERGIVRAVYNVEANKTGRFLGIFKLRMRLEGQIDPETGEFTGKRKPWWAFLVTGEDGDQVGKKVTLCHIPPGNPDAKHTISVGRPALAAHLAHGDYEGACEGEVPPGDGNQTEPGNETNQTMVNITLKEQSNSSEMGTATLTEDNETVIVSLSLTGFPENVSQPAHVHNGSCLNLSEIVYPLTNVLNGTSETTLNVTFSQLESELPLAINVHQSEENSSVYVSCGDLVF